MWLLKEKLFCSSPFWGLGFREGGREGGWGYMVEIALVKGPGGGGGGAGGVFYMLEIRLGVGCFFALFEYIVAKYYGCSLLSG